MLKRRFKGVAFGGVGISLDSDMKTDGEHWADSVEEDGENEIREGNRSSEKKKSGKTEGETKKKG